MIDKLNRTWQADLVARYPALFNQEINGRVLAPGFPCVGDGWRDLVQRAIERIAAAVSEAPDCLRITQIKEKFAAIRIYWWGGPGFTDVMAAAVEEAIELAEARSACTCEQCGEPGRLYQIAGWYKTACDVHGEGTPVASRRPNLGNPRITRRLIDGNVVVRARRYIRATDAFEEVDPSTHNLKPEED
jgi:hypothetical protein